MSTKRKNLPAAIRNVVWNTYIGNDVKTGKCFCCRTELISFANFECGHVVAAANGGNDTIQNLRPICSLCNKSMGTINMINFVKTYGLCGTDDDQLMVKEMIRILELFKGNCGNLFFETGDINDSIDMTFLLNCFATFWAAYYPEYKPTDEFLCNNEGILRKYCETEIFKQKAIVSKKNKKCCFTWKGWSVTCNDL